MPADQDQLTKTLETLFERHGERGYRLAYSLMGNASEADDCLQNAALRLAKSPEKIPSDTPWPWFSVVVLNEARNFWRKRSRRFDLMKELAMSPRDTSDQAEAADAAMLQKERDAALQAALSELKEEQREAISMTWIAGLTQKEAAKALELPLGTLKSRVRQGLDQLRGKLTQHFKDQAQDDNSIGAALAAMPIALPLGGISARISEWIAISLSQTTINAGTLAGGGILMSKGILVAASIAIGILLGTAGTLLISDAPEEGPSLEAKVKSETPKRKPSEARKATKKSTPKATVDPTIALKAEIEGLKQRLKTSDQDKASLRTELDALLAQAKADKEAKAAIRNSKAAIHFGDYQGLSALNGKSLTKMASAYTLANDAHQALLANKKAGKNPSTEQLQRFGKASMDFNLAVRNFALSHQGVFKSQSTRDGAGLSTHPLVIANILLGAMENAGLALSDEQVAAMQKLGEDYERAIAAKSASYDDDALFFVKLYDEWKLKQDFIEQSIAGLSAEQRAIVVKDEVLGLRSAFMLSPSQLLSPLTIRTTSKEQLKKTFVKMIAGHSDISSEALADYDAILDEWMLALEPMLEPGFENKPFTTKEFRMAADAELSALSQMYANEAKGSKRAKAIQGMGTLVLLAMVDGKGNMIMIEEE